MQLHTALISSDTALLLEMSLRAVAVFGIALGLIRISGRRSFGQKTPFDSCLVVLLGAVLSRCIVGASPFIPTVAACMTLALLHRLVAWLSTRFERFEFFIDGVERPLVVNGEIIEKNMRKGLITKRDLYEAVRKNTGSQSLHDIPLALLERDGHISVVKTRSKNYSTQ